MIFDEAKRTYPLVDRTSAICTSLASSVESFTLTTLILVHSIDHPWTQLHYLPWTFLQFLLCVVAQKMLKAFFFFYISLHWHTLREGLSVKHVDVHVHNLPPYSVHPNQYPGTSEIWAFYIRHILWILVPSLLFIFRNLNQSIVSRRFCTRRKYISLFLFLCKMGLTGLHDSPACV